MITRTKPEKEGETKLNKTIHVIYITVIAVILFSSIIIYYANPQTIEINNTFIKRVEVEKIVEVQKECLECEICEVCNCTECKYSDGYVMALMIEAKKCEKSKYYDSLNECSWKLNRTRTRLENCTEEMDKWEDDCDDYCWEFKEEFNYCDDNLTTCRDILEECEECLDECDSECDDDDDNDLEDCSECLDGCKSKCEDE